MSGIHSREHVEHFALARDLLEAVPALDAELDAALARVVHDRGAGIRASA